MENIRRKTPVRTVRLVTAALLLTTLCLGAAGTSSATVTQQDLDAAKAKLVSLNQQLSQLVEQYDQTTIALHRAETRLADAKSEADTAEATAARTRSLLDARVRSAYMNAGSELDLLLGSTTFSEFSERVQFLNGLAGQDADFAAQADLQGRQAQLSSARFADAVQARQDLLNSLDDKTAAIKAGVADQQALIDQLKTQLTKQQLVQLVKDPGPPPPDPGPTPDPSPPPPPPPPPPPVPGAQTAVAAAYTAIGVPYLWGGENPQEGFDCSGLTMWSWAQAGVYLPHSSAAQYAYLPHVSKDSLKPGDLLFFYQPISHVAIYVGNNQMIEAHHPGVSVSVDTISSYWWAVYVGAGRPG